MSKRKSPPSDQLCLWPEEKTVAASSPVIEIPVLDLEALLFYTHENLNYQGPHDQARREQLRTWAEEHGYEELWYTAHWKYDGYLKHGVPDGVDGWTGFLAKVTQFDIYCCFVTVFASHPLSHYLEDAVARGEMKASSLHDDLVWKPGDHHQKRDAKWLRGVK